LQFQAFSSKIRLIRINNSIVIVIAVKSFQAGSEEKFQARSAMALSEMPK
jgi:hypothetical protein